jgi:hypothetical protein
MKMWRLECRVGVIVAQVCFHAWLLWHELLCFSPRDTFTGAGLLQLLHLRRADRFSNRFHVHTVTASFV